MNTLMCLIAMLACAAIMYRCDHVFNDMDSKTPAKYRYAYLFVVAGAAMEFAYLWQTWKVDWFSLILMIGVAIVFLIERRSKVCANVG
jgi:uncharacterized membrane protein YfhO